MSCLDPDLEIERPIWYSWLKKWILELPYKSFCCTSASSSLTTSKKKKRERKSRQYHLIIMESFKYEFLVLLKTYEFVLFSSFSLSLVKAPPWSSTVDWRKLEAGTRSQKALARARWATLCVTLSCFWPHLSWSPIDWPACLITFPALLQPLTQPRKVQKG